jgi:cytosine/adenosine deaminase-related metal-dependent hydrolase
MRVRREQLFRARMPRLLSVVILNGRVIDPETGLDAIRNIGVRGRKIETVSSEGLRGRTTLDARGLVVSPGFIDLHQHGQNAENDTVKAADGVTTALELEVGVADIDAWYAVRAKNALITFGASIGHIPLRMSVMHDGGGLLPSGAALNRVASSQELQEIETGIEKGLKRGALAVGLGPAYTPGATNLEVLKAFEIAARHNASVHVHIRGSGEDPDGTFSGFQEVLADAVATGAALHVVGHDISGPWRKGPIRGRTIQLRLVQCHQVVLVGRGQAGTFHGQVAKW